MNKPNTPCPDDRVLERNRYFFGKLLGTADFEAEQAYFVDKARAHNRLHGFGVVCGLVVEPTDPPSGSVVIQPGVALDCCGNDIVLVDPIELDVAERSDGPNRDRSVYVTLEYGEVEVELAPAPTGGEEEKQQAGRIRELPQAGVADVPPEEGRREFASEVEGVVPCPDCLDPAITLARIGFTRSGPITTPRIDNTVRRTVPIGGRDFHRQLEIGADRWATASEIEGLERRISLLTAALEGLAAALVVSLLWRRRRSP